MASTETQSATPESSPAQARARLGRSPFGVGVAGGVLGSVCCALPAVALALGLSAASSLTLLTRYQPHVLAASLLFVVGATWYLMRRREATCAAEGCSVEERERVRYLLPLAAGGAYVAVYALINYVVVPALYGGRPGV